MVGSKVFNRKNTASLLTWAFLTVLLLIMLTACVGEKSAEQPQNIINANTEAIQPDPIDADSMTDVLNIELPGVLHEPLFDFSLFVNLPPEPPAYRPELKVIPLTSQYSWYELATLGSVAFIDKELNLLPLPGGTPDNFYYVFEVWLEDDERVVYGYVFYIDGHRTYMDVSGNIFFDFYPEPIWGADMSHYYHRNGYLLTAVSDEEKGYRQLCGVMDLRTMRDVLPPVYDAVSLDSASIWAIKDGEEFLYDYEGNLLEQSRENAVSYEYEGFEDLEELWSYETAYRTIYLPSLRRHDGMIAAYSPVRGLSVFTDAGTHLISIENESLYKYYRDERKFIIRLKDDDLLVVYVDGRIKYIQLPDELKNDRWQFDGFFYANGVLTINNWFRDSDYVYNYQEGLLDESEHERSKPYVVSNEVDGCQPERQLHASDGSVLFPYGTYDVYSIYETFILAYKGNLEDWEDYCYYVEDLWENNALRLDVLSGDGELLLQDVYGVICPEPSFPGTAVVWLDEANCVLLEKNGNIRQIARSTKVERVATGYY